MLGVLKGLCEDVDGICSVCQLCSLLIPIGPHKVNNIKQYK